MINRNVIKDFSLVFCSQRKSLVRDINYDSNIGASVTSQMSYKPGFESDDEKNHLKNSKPVSTDYSPLHVDPNRSSNGINN